MATKSRRRPSRKVGGLKVRPLKDQKTKQLKGGPMGPPWIKKTALGQS